MEKNKLIEQENTFTDILIDMKVRMEGLSTDFGDIIERFSDRKPVEERKCFWCKKCDKRLKPNERFVKFEVWQSMFHYHNDLIAETFNIYHTECWNALSKKTKPLRRGRIIAVKQKPQKP